MDAAIYDPASSFLRKIYERINRPPVNYNEEINFMGKTTRCKKEFDKNVSALPYITYRRNFLPTPAKRTTDVGFGCLIFL